MGPQKGAAYAHLQCVSRYLAREKERGREAPELTEVTRLVLANSKMEPSDLETVTKELSRPAAGPNAEPQASG
jgi:hypothetical protein